MKINSFWYLCITVRFSLILIIRWLYSSINNKKMIRLVISSFITIIGIGFLYKALTGSNNETQIAKVFWHETRLVHASFFLLAGFYMLNDNINMTSLLLFNDLIFSFMYRIYFNY